jgi:glutathione reductase (NADPH)
LELKERPQRVLIVGGGYIAVEFAGIFAALGSEVTLVIRAGQILRGFDEDVRATLSAELEKQGIRIQRDCLIRSVEKTGQGYSVYFDMGEEKVVDCVMFATGRAPNTANIGLKEVGVRLDTKGAMVVDEWNKSSVASIYAVGDVTDRVNLTPVAINEGRVFAETFFNKNPHTLSGRDERTMMKLIVDKATDKVLGCHMVGDDAPEIIQGLAVALKCGATKAQFDATVGIHPTAAEEFVTMRDPLPEKEAATADS